MTETAAHPSPLPAPATLADVPAGKVAAIVTFLEMHAQPAPLPAPEAPHLSLRHVTAPETGWYRDLFRRIGEDWLWYSRLQMSEAQLAPSSSARTWRSTRSRAPSRMAADRHRAGRSGISAPRERRNWRFSGWWPAKPGSGAGRLMMNLATARAFARPIRRFFVHTCTHDLPAAVGFYRKSGFNPMAARWRSSTTPASTARCAARRRRMSRSLSERDEGAVGKPTLPKGFRRRVFRWIPLAFR